jgi:hypothetical protein
MSYFGTPDSERPMPSEKIYNKERMHETLRNHFGDAEYRELEIEEKFKPDDVCYHQLENNLTISDEDSLQVSEGYVYYFCHKPFFRKIS